MKSLRILLLTFTMGCCSSIAVGQDNGWSKVYDFGEKLSYINGVQIIQDTIYVFSRVVLKSNGSNQYLVAKLDSFGNIIKTKLISDIDGYQLVQNPGWPIILTKKNKFVTVISRFEIQKRLVLQIDKDFNVDSMTMQPNPIYDRIFGEDMIEIDDGFVIAGEIQLPDLKIVGIVRKLDKLGNVIWDKIIDYPEEDYVQIRSIVRYQSGFKIYGSKVKKGLFPNMVDTTDFDGHSIILTLDSEGEVLHEWESPQAEENSIGIAKSIQDTQLYFTYKAYINSVDNCFNQVLKLVTRSSDNDLIKKVTIPAKPYCSGFERIFDLVPLSDGKWLGVGYWRNATEDKVWNYYDYEAGGLVKFNSNLDLLWQRSDTFPNSIHGDTNRLYAAAELSSGSIIAVGQHDRYKIGQDSITTLGWIIKVDKNGCMNNDDCANVFTAVQEVKEVPKQIEIYPNPAISEVQLINTGNQSDIQYFEGNGLQIAFYDTYGRLALQKDLDYLDDKIDISSLSNGLYIYKIYADKRIFGQGKLVVVR